MLKDRNVWLLLAANLPGRDVLPTGWAAFALECSAACWDSLQLPMSLGRIRTLGSLRPTAWIAISRPNPGPICLAKPPESTGLVTPWNGKASAACEG